MVESPVVPTSDAEQIPGHNIDSRGTFNVEGDTYPGRNQFTPHLAIDIRPGLDEEAKVEKTEHHSEDIEQV